MEKFFIVTNEQFLKEIDDFKENERIRNDFIKEFFEEHGIYGSAYYIRGDGCVNVPFKDYEKKNINLYIGKSEENTEKFGKQLKKPVRFDDGYYLYAFRKDSSILKEFQQACVDKGIVINNHWHREGDYFNELRMGGYSVTRFSFDGKYYLHMETQKNGITPRYDGFEEIKGSEFYIAFEKRKELDKTVETPQS